ncbi:MAG: hypothetical protein IPJ84_08790 [Bdellovibrionales bacterium]|nr:hypothetical protein [Bdellovibrionales bacterium]
MATLSIGKTPLSVPLVLLVGLLGGCTESPSVPPKLDGKTCDGDTSKRIQQIRAENQAMVAAATEVLKDGEEVRVSEIVEPQEHNLCGDIRSKYRLRRVGRRLELRVKLRLEARPHESTASVDRAIGKTQDCQPQLAAFWARYGIDFKLEVTKQSNAQANHSVSVQDGTGRSDSGQFFQDIPQYCEMVMHEIGHHVGLPDEYEETNTCRVLAAKATETCPSSIMETPYVSAFELMPRHLKTILGPVFEPIGEGTSPAFRVRVLRDVELKQPRLFGGLPVLRVGLGGQIDEAGFGPESGECKLEFSVFDGRRAALEKGDVVSAKVNLNSFRRSKEGRASLLPRIGFEPIHSGGGRVSLYSFSCNQVGVTEPAQLLTSLRALLGPNFEISYSEN